MIDGKRYAAPRNAENCRWCLQPITPIAIQLGDGEKGGGPPDEGKAGHGRLAVHRDGAHQLVHLSAPVVAEPRNAQERDGWPQEPVPEHLGPRNILRSPRRIVRLDFREPVLLSSGLNLLINTIVYWNTLYLEPAFAELNREGIPTPFDTIKHITPLGWQHISLTGDYIWTPTDGVDLRPLRQQTSILAA